MAVKKPLVLYGAQQAQIQPGDSVETPMSVQQVNDETTPMVIGTPVYNDVAAGVRRAKADAAATKDVIGLWADVSTPAAASGYVAQAGSLSATTAQWDAVIGGSGGLTPKARYYLDPAAAGRLVATPPSLSGQFLVEVGIALSPTVMRIQIRPDIQL